MLLDLIFPKFCLGCLVEGTYLCQGCQSKIITIKHQTCPVCHVITRRGTWCTSHKKNQALSGIMTLGYYHDPILREAIHLIKYRRIDELTGVLAGLLERQMEALLPHKHVLVVPVPLHPWRLRYRDFNQAELLATHLAKNWHLQCLNGLLIRTKNTQPQAELSHSQRLINVRNSFALKGDSHHIKNKTIWLVDDVATTGSTLEACAQVLKHHGAKSVWGIVLAKG